MDILRNVRFPITVLLIVAALELIVIVYMLPVSRPLVGLGKAVVEPTGDFQYSNSLTCKIVQTTHQKGDGVSLPWYEVMEFEVIGLDTEHPKLLTDYYPQGVELKKAYESDEYLTLENTDPSWDTQVIGIMKKEGVFVRTMTGLQAGDWEYHYSIAQKGRCE